MHVRCCITPWKPVSHSISSSWNSTDDVLTLCRLKNSLATHICVYPFNHVNVHNTFHIPKGMSNIFRILKGKHDLCWTCNHSSIHNRKSLILKVTYILEAEDCQNCIFLAQGQINIREGSAR